MVPGAGALTVWPSDATASPLFAQGPKDKDGKPTAPQDPQTLNRYSYVENNPISKNDSSGHCSGGSTWNNFVSIFNGTCFQKGMFIMAHARKPGDWALGAFAAAGGPTAIALFVAGTYGLGAAAIPAIAAMSSGDAIGVSPAIAQKFLGEAQKGGICWDCVLKAVGGRAIRGGNDAPAALKELGYELTSSPKPNDIAVFVGREFGNVRGSSGFAVGVNQGLPH